MLVKGNIFSEILFLFKTSFIKRSLCLLLCGGSLLFFSDCGQGKAGGSEEGLIEFDTKGVDPNHPLYGFAPSSATMKFKGEKLAVEMSTMGMFNTSIICDNQLKTIAQTVKFLDVKQACIQKKEQIEAENGKYPLRIEETGDTKKIAGLKCYRLKVTKVNEPQIKFDAWYTKELGMEDCNALTPYAKVKGVLMDYRVERMGMELHFSARSYKHLEIPEHTFDIPASMKIVSPEEMQKFFNNLQ